MIKKTVSNSNNKRDSNSIRTIVCENLGEKIKEEVNQEIYLYLFWNINRKKSEDNIRPYIRNYS